MRKTLLTILLLFPFFVNAQFNIGYNKSGKYGIVGKFEDDQIDLFKSTTTAFVLLDRDTPNIALFEQAIKSVWTITPFVIIRSSEVSKYSNKKQYSLFSFRYEERSESSNSGSHMAKYTMHMFYQLSIADGTKKDISHSIANAELYPDNDLRLMLRNAHLRHDGYNSDKRVEEDACKIIANHKLYNWGPGFLRSYLKIIQENLLAKKRRDHMFEFADNARLKSLKNDTLYVPDYIFIKYNISTGDTHEDDELDDNKLLDVYPYPIKFVSADELNKMIMESTQGIKYLVYIKSGDKKKVNIYDSKDDQLIYADMKNMSYNFKYKDFGNLAEEID